MSKWKIMLLAGAMTMTPVGVAAQEAPAAETVADANAADADAMPEASPEDAKAKMQREMDAAIAMVEKIFDTSDLPPVAPAQLALAQQTTAALIPSGSLEKMIDNLYGKFLTAIMEQVGGQSDMMISIKTGVESEQIAALDADTKNAIANLFDPHRKEREDQVTNVIKPLISEVLADLEPPMRAGLAKAYARKFTADQLTQINGFFATSAGKFYANESMALQADPEVMVALIKAIPPMITKFIDRAPTLESQFKELPKEKALTDLSKDEMAKLAKLLKVPVKQLEEQRDLYAVNDAAAEGAADAADAAGDAVAAAEGDYAAEIGEWSYSENWSEEDRATVEKLQQAQTDASTALIEAEMAAIERARLRMGGKDAPAPSASD